MRPDGIHTLRNFSETGPVYQKFKSWTATFGAFDSKLRIAAHASRESLLIMDFDTADYFDHTRC